MTVEEENAVFRRTVLYRDGTKDKFTFFGMSILIAIVIVVIYLSTDPLFPYAQVLVEIVVMLVAVFTLGGMYRLREDSIAERGPIDGYRHAFYHRHVPAMPLIYVSALHPIFAANDQPRLWPLIVGLILGVYLILSALALHARAIRTFGIDNLFMFHLYVPEERGRVSHSVYHYLRHPVYSAMCRMSVGLGFCFGTRDSVLLGLIVPLAQLAWLKIYEERELVERFGSGYHDYMKQTNALFVRPRQWSKFVRLLVTGKE